MFQWHQMHKISVRTFQLNEKCLNQPFSISYGKFCYTYSVNAGVCHTQIAHSDVSQ